MEIMNLSITDFLLQLSGIILIDLALGGDNAIVIGMACRNLPRKTRMKGVVLGTIGAVVVRGSATVAVVWLLKIQFLKLAGGLILVYIGIKLLIKQDSDSDVKESNTLLRAVLTIISADAIMGIDNVLGVAGVADGHVGMVIIGLALSIPIMVLGSTIIMRLMDRFKIIIYLGAGVILYTAGHMIVTEPATVSFFESLPVLYWAIIAVITLGGLAFGILYNKRKRIKRKETENENQ